MGYMELSIHMAIASVTINCIFPATSVNWICNGYMFTTTQDVCSMHQYYFILYRHVMAYSCSFRPTFTIDQLHCLTLFSILPEDLHFSRQLNLIWNWSRENIGINRLVMGMDVIDMTHLWVAFSLRTQQLLVPSSCNASLRTCTAFMRALGLFLTSVHFTNRLSGCVFCFLHWF